MASFPREVEVEECWDYIGGDPEIPSIEATLTGPAGSLAVKLRIDTGYPGYVMLSTKLYEELGFHLAELPEKEFGIYRTAVGPFEVKRAMGVISIRGLFSGEVVVETPRRLLFERDLAGRSLLNNLALLLDGQALKACAVRPVLRQGCAPRCR